MTDKMTEEFADMQLKKAGYKSKKKGILRRLGGGISKRMQERAELKRVEREAYKKALPEMRREAAKRKGKERAREKLVSKDRGRTAGKIALSIGKSYGRRVIKSRGNLFDVPTYGEVKSEYGKTFPTKRKRTSKRNKHGTIVIKLDRGSRKVKKAKRRTSSKTSRNPYSYKI